MTDSVTGRDGYIVAKALYWAIKFSQAKPEGFREWSDEQDMKAILNNRYPQFANGFPEQDRAMIELLSREKASGKQVSDYETIVAHYTPPNLIDEKLDAVFIKDGDTLTPEPEFIVDTKGDAYDLAATLAEIDRMPEEKYRRLSKRPT